MKLYQTLRGLLKKWSEYKRGNSKDSLFKNDDFAFSYRVGGLLIHNGKILLQRIKNNDNYASEKIGIGKAGYMVYKTLVMNIVSSYDIIRNL